MPPLPTVRPGKANKPCALADSLAMEGSREKLGPGNVPHWLSTLCFYKFRHEKRPGENLLLIRKSISWCACHEMLQ